MALIRTFRAPTDRTVRFASEVDCGWVIGERDGRRILHLETYGSESRASRPEPGQTFDLDEAGAAGQRFGVDHERADINAYPRYAFVHANDDQPG